MRLGDAYRRYRVWAARGNAASVASPGAFGAFVGSLVLGVASMYGREVVLWRVLPWIIALLAPIAAFDAWGAAMFRGSPREAWARACVVLILLGAFPVYALIFR